MPVTFSGLTVDLITDTTARITVTVAGAGGPGNKYILLGVGFVTDPWGTATIERSDIGSYPWANGSQNATITGLTANTVYYAQAAVFDADSYTVGETSGSIMFTTDGPPPVPKTPKPPLELTVNLRGPGGQQFRLAPDARAAGDRPLDLSFATEAGEGFATGQITLVRHYDQEFPDLALLNEAVLEGHSGDIAYEGRIQGVPRSLGAGGPEIRLDCQGWMSHARAQPFTELLIDRDLTQWGEASRARRAQARPVVSTYNTSITPTVEDGLIFTGPSGETLPQYAYAELVYRTPSGQQITAVHYRGTQVNTTGIDAPQLNVANNEIFTSGAADLTLTLDDTFRVASTDPKLWVKLNARANTASTPGAGSAFQRSYSMVAVIGTHGLTVATGDAPTVALSDAITYLLNRYAPLLDTTQIQPNTFPVPHAVWREPTTAQDAVKQLNAYSQWALAVYENRQLEYRPFDLSTYDWEVRAGQDGVEIETQGVTIEDAFNGVIVKYQDWAGQDQIITPDQTTDLQDPDPAIAANQWGERAWTTLDLTNPQTADAAIQIGRMYLADLNRPKFPSTITVPGHIRDRAGAWQPAWKVRANQTISVRNHPNDHPRLITGTTWSGNTLQITTDNALNRMEAILTRLDRGRNPGGN